MNRTNLRDLSLALLALGFLFLFFSVAAYFGGMPVAGLHGAGMSYSFRQYSGLLLVVGVVSLVLGFGFRWSVKQGKSLQTIASKNA